MACRAGQSARPRLRTLIPLLTPTMRLAKITTKTTVTTTIALSSTTPFKRAPCATRRAT